MKNLILVFMLALSACAHDRFTLKDNNATNESGRIQSTLKWVKVKSGKMDFSLILTNTGKESVYWEQNGAVATYGAATGSFIIKGNKGQVVPPGGSVVEVITLGFNDSFPIESKGSLTISPIYDYSKGSKGEKLLPLVHLFELKLPLHHR